MTTAISRFIEKCRYAHAHPVEGGYRHALKLVVPMVLANSVLVVMQFTDRILLSRYSSLSIQAAVPSGMLSFTLISFFSAIAGYSSTFVAQYHGAKDAKSSVKSCVSGLWIALACIPIFIAMIPFCDAILGSFGHAPELLEQERIYSFWMVLSGFLMTTHWVMGGYLTSRDRVLAGTLVSVAGCIVNIALDWVMIFGFGGFPAMGLRGAAIATFASSVFGTLALLAMILPDIVKAGARDVLAPDFSLIWRIIRFGIPSGLHTVFDAGSYSLFTLLTARLSPLELATSNIAFSINCLAISPLIGFGSAAGILVGQFQGAGRGDLAKRSGWRCLHLAWIYMAACAVLFICFPGELLACFRSADAPYTVDQMLRLGRLLLLMMAGWGMFDTMNAVFIGALKGAGDTPFVMLTISLLAWFFWIPAELLALNVPPLAFHPRAFLGYFIIDAWVVQVIYLITLAFFFLVRWCRGRWMKIDLIDKEGAKA